MAAAGESESPKYEVLLKAAKAIDSLIVNVRELSEQVECQGKSLVIRGTTIYEITADCTCGGKSKHEKLCGLSPIANLTELPGFHEIFESTER